MTKNKRLPPKDRAAELMEVALRLAERHGLANLTRERIADEAGVSCGLVTTRLKTMTVLRRNIMRAAVTREILPIVAEGLAARNEHALAAPLGLRERAVASMVGAAV